MDFPHPNSSSQALQPSLCRRLFACVLPRSAPFLRAGALGILIHGTAFAQTTYDWFDTAPDGNWTQGAPGARWTDGLYNQPPSGNSLRFNNNHQLNMTNNVSSYSVHQLIFGSANTSSRTIGGNALSMNDWSGTDPKIENQSTGSHTITLNLTVDVDDPLELNPTSGDLTFNGTINNNGSAIFVYGDNAKGLFLNGVVSGSGSLVVKQYSKVINTAAHTYSGNTYIDEGEFWIGQGASVSGTIDVGASAQPANVSKLFISDADGGTTVANNITVQTGNTDTRFIGGLNTSGTNTYSGTITLNSGLILETASGGNLNVSGVISGANAIYNKHTGTLILSGNNTFSGGSYLSANSTTLLGHDKGLGTGTIEISFGASTTQTLASSNATARALTNNLNIYNNAVIFGQASGGTGALTLSGNVSIGSDGSPVTRTLTINNASTTWSGIVSGGANNALTKAGTGTLVLSGANTYAGTTTLSAGTLAINNNTAIGTGTLTITGGVLDNTSGSSKTLTNNNAQNWNANFTVAGTGDLNMGTGAVTMSATRTVTVSAGNFTVGGVIGGAFGLTKAGTGTLVLSGNNTFSGGVSTSGSGGKVIVGHNNALGTGTATLSGSNVFLELADGITIANAMTVSDTGSIKTIQLASGATSATYSGAIAINETNALDHFRLNVGSGGTLTFSGNLSGNRIYKLGDGTVVLTGNNTYTGLTTVSAGVLNIRHNNALGTTDAGTTVTSGAALELQGGITIGAEALSLSGTGISSGGALRNISGDNSYAGAITLAAASRINSDAGLLTLSGAIGGAFALTVGGAGNTTISNAIGTSTGTLTKDGAGTLTLSGANTYTGATTISAGMLAGANANAFGSGSISVSGSGTLSLRGDASTSFVKASDSTAYTIQTSASGATINVDQATGAGTASKTMTIGSLGTSSTTANYQVNFTGGNNTSLSLGAVTGPVSTGGGPTVTLSNSISGGGGLTLASYTSAATGGPETLAFSGNGNTTVTGAISPSSTVLSLTKSGDGTLTLAGNNTYTGATTISVGVLNIRHANALGTTAGSTTVTSGAALELQGGITVGAEALSLSGTGLSTAGALRNISGDNSYAGAITLAAHSTIGSDAGTLTLSGGITGTKDLTIVGAGNTSIVGNITTSASALTKNGTGTLFLSGTNSTYTGATTINAGVLNVAYLTNSSVSGALGNTTTSNTRLQLGDGTLQYTGSNATSSDRGFSIIGNATFDASGNGSGATMSLTKTGSADSLFSGNKILTLTGSNTGSNHISAALGDNSSVNRLAVVKSGVGTWVMSGSNTFTGGLAINSGTLIGTVAGAMGNASNTVTFGGAGAGVLNLQAAATTYTALLNVASANGTILINPAASGAGVTHTIGATTLGGGYQLTVQGGSNVASGTAQLTTGAITLNGDGSIRVLNPVAGSSKFNTASDITGTGNLTLKNDGATTGGITISGTTNHTGTITNSGSGTGDVTLGVIGTNVTGVTQNSAASALNLSGNNTYTGATTISAGTLQIGAAGRLGAGSYAGAISNNATLIYSGTNAQTLSGIISGTGALTQNAASTLTLSGNNTYLGATTISAGTIEIGAAGRLGAGTYAQNITNNGTFVYASTNNQTLSGIISGTGALTQNAASTLTLSGNNTYSGATSISTGTIEIGAAGRLGAGTYAGAISNNASLIYSGTNNQTLSGIISGTGALTQNAASTLTLTGNNTYTGVTTISTGTIEIGAAGRLGAGTYAGAISNNATLIYSGTNAQTLSGIISGTGALTQNNSGSTLTLTGANTYTGTTTINAGTLQLGNNGATGSLSADSAITVNGALVFRRSDAITQGTNFSTAAITGTGVVIQNSANSTTLNNITNSFSGGVWVQQGTVYAAGIGNASASGYLGSCGTIQLGSSSNTGTLRLTGSTSETTDKVIDLAGTTGGGMLNVDSSAAIYTFSNSFTASGVGAKTLTLQGSGTSSGGFVLNGAIVDSSSGATSLSVGGNGSLTVTLGCATNSFSGPVSIVGNTSGKTYTLQVAGIGNTGAASYLGSNSTISLGTSSSGTNILKYTGTGETTDKVINLASTNNNNQASLDASNASGLLKFTSNFTATGTASTKILNLIGTGNAEIAGAIVNNTSGNVTNVTKSGAGTWTLSGNNTYTGTTTISGGTLVISGTNSGSAITVSSGGTLAGTGTGGDTTVNSGGKISPGNSPGILTVGGLTLNGNGTYTWEMADATGAAGTGWDQINATGLLTVGSNATSTFKIAITSSGAPTNWDYTTTNQTWDIIDYGSISGFNASYFTLNSTAFAGDLSVDSSWSLVDTGSALRLTYTYTQNTPTYTGASGNWSTGFSPSLDNTENAVFVGVGGTATNDIASGTLSSIGTLTFDGSNSYTLEAASGSAGYNSAAALAIGGTIVNNSSAVQTINLATSFAANQTINANTGGLVIGGNVSIGTGAILTVLGSNNTTLSGVVSGLGGLTKNSSSTLTLSGNNSYSGGTTITAGTLLVGHDKALGTGTLRFGGTIASTDGTDRTISNTVAGLSGTWTYTFGQASGGTGNLTFTDAANATFASTGVKTFNVLNTTSFANSFISTGNVTVTKIGGGTLILAGNSTYSGSTIINAGTLQIGNGGTSGALSASSTITNNGTLVFNRSNTVAQGTNFSTAAITGTGSIIQNGSGNLTLNAANTYSGGTTLNTGTLVIGNAAAAGTGTITQTDGTSLLKIDTTGTIANTMSVSNVLASQSATLSGAITVNNATWDVETGVTLTLSGGVGGTGGVTKNGTGSMVLSGSNTYSGATVVNAGTLNAAHANALGTNTSVTVNGGSLLVSADDAINGKNLTLASTANGSASAASLAFSGTYNGTAGLLTLNADSIIDLGTGSVAVHFSDLSMGFYSLSIYNWTGTTLWGGGDGNNTDQFYIDRPLTSGELNKISFYSGIGSSSFVGTGYQLSGGSFNNEVIPVPEPETYATAVLLLIGLCFFVRHNRRKRRFY